MIKVKIYRDKNGNICGFDADDHGDSIVCAAVSILVLNTVNSIEAFTEEKFACDHHASGGYISFRLSGESGHDANLLLNSMLLGLEGIQSEYKKHLRISFENVS